LRILAFQAYYETIAEPFEWKVIRTDLRRLLDKVESELQAQAA